MTHSGSPKKFLFGPDSVEISDISTGNIIDKGVANHASKAYEFSHFLPYSTPAQSQQPFERGGINSLSSPFADNDILSNISFSDDEEKDEHDLDINTIPQDDPDQIQLLF